MRGWLYRHRNTIKLSGIAIAGVGLLLSFADLMDWLRDSDREKLVEWVLTSEVGLPINDPTAQAFLRSFPPPPEARADKITHLTKTVIRYEAGGIQSASINYMHTDHSRTAHVATFEEVRDWARETSYRWLALWLTLCGFAQVSAAYIVEQRHGNAA